VVTATDTTLVVVSPGWGDAVQVAKAGILEIADVFVVNKADREGADDAVRDLHQMLRMGPKQAWTPPVVRTSTVTGDGIDDLSAAVERHRDHQESAGELARKRRARVFAEVQGMVAERLRRRVANILDGGSGEALAEDLAERRIDPYRAAALLLERMTDADDTERTAGERDA